MKVAKLSKIYFCAMSSKLENRYAGLAAVRPTGLLYTVYKRVSDVGIH
jgi:hypothetical protein